MNAVKAALEPQSETPIADKMKTLKSPPVMIRDDYGNLRPAKPGEGVGFRGGSHQVMGEHGELRNRFRKLNKKERRARRSELKILAEEQAGYQQKETASDERTECSNRDYQEASGNDRQGQESNRQLAAQAGKIP